MRHQRQPLTLIFLMPILLAIVSLGCGLTSRFAALSDDSETFLPTRTPMPTFTPTPMGAAFVEAPVISTEQNSTEPISDQSGDIQEAASAQEQPTEAEQSPVGEQGEPEEAAPSPTATLVVEPSPTPEPVVDDTVTITVLQNMNVRGGPGTNYNIVSAGSAGDNALVVGRNGDGSWVQVEYSGNKGWLYSDLVEVSGNLETVPVVEAPPAPPPVAAAPPPEEEAPPPAPPEPQYQFTPTGWHASENAAIVHFKGRITDEAGNLVNGYSVRLDNWSMSIISHPTGASGWYPEKGDGEWDVSGIPLGAGQGWWWLSVVRYECDFWAGFDSQCENFTTLSEEVKIEVRTPDESVINADWICHWDCDKGLYTEGYER